VVLRCYEGALVDEAVPDALARCLGDVEGVQTVVRRDHASHSSGAQRREVEARASWLVGGPIEGPFAVTEDDVRYEVALDEDLGCGLYLDQRANRRWVRERAADAEVLNLFAYTCGFSVAAAVGGARRTTSVDIARRALERGQRSLQLNGIEPALHRFFSDDAIEALERAKRRSESYDIVICDPPSFARRKGGHFRLERDLDTLVALCVDRVAPDGWLLFSLNHRQIRLATLRQAIEQAANQRLVGLEAEIIEDGYSPLGVGTDLKCVRAQLR